MQIINEKTVELTKFEQHVQTAFELLLDRGYGIPQSVERIKELHPNMDPAFYRWLGDKPLMPSDKEDDTVPAMVPGYQESLQIFRDLLEQENLDAGFGDEYVRGGVELLADMFGVPGDYHADRKVQVLADLRNLEAN